MYESNIKGNLARRYKIKHFLAFNEQAKEALWQGFSVIFFTLVISYFMSHWLLWLTGLTQTNQIKMIFTKKTEDTKENISARIELLNEEILDYKISIERAKLSIKENNQWITKNNKRVKEMQDEAKELISKLNNDN